MKPTVKISPQKALQLLKSNSTITITPKSLPILAKYLKKPK